VPVDIDSLDDAKCARDILDKDHALTSRHQVREFEDSGHAGTPWRTHQVVDALRDREDYCERVVEVGDRDSNDCCKVVIADQPLYCAASKKPALRGAEVGKEGRTESSA
jgi:hypothetical protein